MFKFRLGLSAAFLTVLVVGCGTENPVPAKVRGVVRYNGKPLHGGNVIFHSSDKGSYNATIAQDGSGNYEAVDLPTGELQVSVVTEFLNPNPKGGSAKFAKAASKIDAEYAAGMTKMKAAAGAPVSSAELAARYTKIPDKYGNKDTSGLVVTLERGKNEFDFDLKD